MGRPKRKISTDSVEDEGDTDSEEEDLEPTVKNKVKRGQINKKSYEESEEEDEEENDYDEDDDDTDTENEEDDVKPPAKKVKGRPKLAKAFEESEDSADSDDEMNLSQRLKEKKVSPAKMNSPTVKTLKKGKGKKNVTSAKKKVKLDESEAIEELQDEFEADEPAAEKDNISLASETSSNKLPICEQCGLEFAKPGFKRHTMREHKFPCKTCDRKFVSKTKLVVHNKTHREKSIEDSDSECSRCGLSFSSMELKNVAEHKKVKHTFSCASCDKQFTSSDRLSTHQWSNHNSDLDPEFRCSHCDQTFSNEDGNIRIVELEHHIRTMHMVGCDKCGSSYLGEDTHLCSPEPSVMVEGKMLDEISEEYPGDQEPLEDESERESSLGTTCYKCGIEFDDKNVNRKHVKLPHPYDCSDCELHFMSEPRLRYHSIVCHNEEDQIKTDCSLCNEKFPEIIEYLEHWETLHKHACVKCDKKFISLMSLERHSDIVHPVVLCCSLCRMDFTGKPMDYADHKRTSHKFTCYTCDRSYIKGQHLSKHMEIDHDDDEIKCKLCGMSFGDFWQQLEAHLNEQHRFPCDKCDMKFLSKDGKEKHALDVHGVVKGLDLRCGQCHQEFSETATFREHFKVPHTSSCPQCELKFPSSESLATHVSIVHNKQERLVCDMCKKKFGSNEQNLYAEHIQTPHTHECETCESTFIKANKLKEHIEERHGRSKHFDDKYTCKLCGTVCTKNNDSKLSREALNKHNSIPHKFPCKSCSLRFTNKHKLEAHFVESHTNSGAKNNECSVCGTHISDPKVLRDHRKRPHNHPCRNAKCDKKFISESALEKHLQRKHKEFAAAKLAGGKVVFTCKLCDKVLNGIFSIVLCLICKGQG